MASKNEIKITGYVSYYEEFQFQSGDLKISFQISLGAKEYFKVQCPAFLSSQIRGKFGDDWMVTLEGSLRHKKNEKDGKKYSYIEPIILFPVFPPNPNKQQGNQNYAQQGGNVNQGHQSKGPYIPNNGQYAHQTPHQNPGSNNQYQNQPRPGMQSGMDQVPF